MYYSSFNSERSTPSILKLFFSPNFEEKLLNFSKKRYANINRTEIIIPKDGNSFINKTVPDGETEEGYFFVLLLNDLLSKIIERISKYSFSSTLNSRYDNYKNESELFSK